MSYFDMSCSLAHNIHWRWLRKTHIHTQIFKTPLSPPLSVSLSLSLCLCLSLSLSFSLSLFLSVCLSVSLCAVEADLECPFSQQRNWNQIHFILSCPMYYDLSPTPTRYFYTKGFYSTQYYLVRTDVVPVTLRWSKVAWLCSLPQLTWPHGLF